MRSSIKSWAQLFPVLVHCVCAAFLLEPACAQNLQILDVHLGAQGQVVLDHSSDTNSYYVLYRGTEVLDITHPVAVAAGAADTGQLTDSGAGGSSNAMFYRVRQVPVGASLDLDQDGIPDVWELEHGINPLDAHDASLIKPETSETWLDFYKKSLPALASFATAGSTNLVSQKPFGVKVEFNKAFTNTVYVQVGGTALRPQDYDIPGATVAVPGDNSILEVPVSGSGTEATITIQPVDSPEIQPVRTITLSLVEPADGSYHLSTNGPVTHVAVLTESSLASGGVLAGTLATTNAVLLDPQPLTVAVRGDSTGKLVAYFDTSRAGFFNKPFSIPVKIGPNGVQFSGPATGTLPSATVPGGSAPQWQLSFPESSTDTNGVLTAVFRLDLTRLTAGNRTTTARGTLIMAPIK